MKFRCCVFATIISSASLSMLPKLAADQVQQIYYETPYRILSNKDPLGFSVELDDGSIWRILDKTSAKEVQAWRINDTLVIHPTVSPYWSGSRFFILNERLKSTATAEISYGPIIGQPTCNQIIYIDYLNGTLQLQDGSGRTSFWRLDLADRFSFQRWKFGQTVILGSNQNCCSGWFSSYPYILINVEKNEYIHGIIN